MQIGGADQFGNITAGMRVVDQLVPDQIDKQNWPERFTPDARRVGLTVPLLTTAAGTKFGKSEGQPVWLNPETTSTFDLYQVCADVPSRLQTYLTSCSSSFARPMQTSNVI